MFVVPGGNALQSERDEVALLQTAAGMAVFAAEWDREWSNCSKNGSICRRKGPGVVKLQQEWKYLPQNGAWISHSSRPDYAQSESPVWKTGYSDGYHWTTYKWGGEKSLTKYCTDSSYGTVDKKTVLEASDDVAHVKWGGSWRMPTKAEFDELISNCTWTWTAQNGVNGYKVTSKKSGYTSMSIFLPAAGYRGDGNLTSVGSNGGYWSSSLFTGNPGRAGFLGFDLDGVYMGIGSRFYGQSVRPVSE